MSYWVNPNYTREVRDDGGITYRRKPVDIIDEIDQLVDEQMADGESRTGFDYGDPKYPRCWHCGRHWHGLPITERIAAMYAAGQFDEDYRSDADDSRVLCRGSEFIGPMPAPIQPSWMKISDRPYPPLINLSGLTGSPGFINDLIQATFEYLAELTGLITWPEPYPEPITYRRWLSGDDEPHQENRLLPMRLEDA